MLPTGQKHAAHHEFAALLDHIENYPALTVFHQAHHLWQCRNRGVSRLGWKFNRLPQGRWPNEDRNY